jgi:trans-2,3-dihydro-3-hydroxyanthranilate isomerase
MRTIKSSFYLVDVFAEEKYSGNQLAVFRNADSLSDERMQQIANEMHFSETTFILSDKQRNCGFDVRIFTPLKEVPFAGHPTLGTAYVIRHFILGEAVTRVLLNLKMGQIPVTFEKTSDESFGWIEQVSPFFGKTFSVQEFAKLLQLDVNDFDQRYPIEEVSTGLPFIIVPLKTLAAVKQAKVNTENLLGTLKKVNAGVLVFCPETYHKDNDLNVRVFAYIFGITEDPATGSGNGCLAGYLSHHRYFGTDRVTTRVEQGYEVHRRSLLWLKAEGKAAKIRVCVGGKVILIGEGKLE